MQLLRKLGLKARCYAIAVPTYYGGNMTLGLASDTLEALQPDLTTIEARFRKANFKTVHYTPELHCASFVLPRWMQEITGGLA
jgi:spermidine synthase